MHDRRLRQRRPPRDEGLVPVWLVVEDQAFDRLVRLIGGPPRPTKALRDLMRALS
ncbi:MAG: hypothetical protein JNM50_01050 [Chromatiales bacterium]|jgi:hypothetical protein|nr:hypothetical protein [Chromatiales bacterium]